MDPPAKEVGDAFANEYYDHLQNSPENLYKCYTDNSNISRPGLDGTMRTSTLSDIGEDLNMLSSGGFDSVQVTSVISQESHSDGILVVFDGYFTFNERRERNFFTQTFFLAAQEKGHFVVISDMFKFVDISEGAAICVKNLPPNATIDLVENAFKQFGDIKRGETELRHKEGFSYGFVEFKEAKAVQKAIEASPIMIDGSTSYVEKKRPGYRSYWETKGYDESLRVSERNDNTRNENNEESQAVTDQEACICVKNLPPNATIDLVKNAFNHFGEIRRHGIKFHKQRKPRYCFVEFEEADAAKRAMMESPIMIDGSTCYVEKKQPDYEIHLKYLPRTATIDMVEDAFNKFGPIKRGGVRIITPSWNYWYGFVEYEEADAAKKAIEASPLMIDGHTTHVKKKRPDHKKIKADAVDDIENGNNQESQAVTEEAGICVKRLPPKATIDLVENAFKQFGPIKKGGITIESPMMNYWYGFVEFEEADAAKRAIEASPVKINGKDVHVEKAKDKGETE